MVIVHKPGEFWMIVACISSPGETDPITMDTAGRISYQAKYCVAPFCVIEDVPV
jgi:hypothetical protein